MILIGMIMFVLGSAMEKTVDIRTVDKQRELSVRKMVGRMCWNIVLQMRIV